MFVESPARFLSLSAVFSQQSMKGRHYNTNSTPALKILKAGVNYIHMVHGTSSFTNRNSSKWTLPPYIIKLVKLRRSQEINTEWMQPQEEHFYKCCTWFHGQTCHRSWGKQCYNFDRRRSDCQMQCLQLLYAKTVNLGKINQRNHKWEQTKWSTQTYLV